MRPRIYSRFVETQLILTDELAIDRTLLANERTLLAYLRAGMALIIAGATMAHFSHQGWFLVAGIACLPAGFICAIIGVVRYIRTNRAILLIRDKMPSTGITKAPPGPSSSAPENEKEEAAS
jgi:putative membrane protein